MGRLLTLKLFSENIVFINREGNKQQSVLPAMGVKQLKRILYLILLVSIMSACSNGTSLLKQEGIIVEINERQDRWNQILVVPNISEDDISNKTTTELMEMAQENDGAYYSLEPGEYE